MSSINPNIIPSQLSNFVNNEAYSPSEDTSYVQVFSPKDALVITKVPCSTKQDVDFAINKAAEAFKAWSTKTVKDRCSYLIKCHSLLMDHMGVITDLIVLEHGKTKTEAIGSFKKGLETLEFAIGLPPLFAGSVLEVSRGISCHDQKMPLGVVASIVPFNFPIMVPFWTLPIAIACGNTFILKPSEKVPLTMNYVIKLLGSILPPGVINIVHGQKDTVEFIIENPMVKAVTFVGTTNVAKIISRKCRALDKRCLALGGAKNFLIALPDCNVEMTAKDIVSSYSGCCGQRCMAASALLIVGDQQKLLSLIKTHSEKLTPGSADGQMGPVIDEQSKQKICSYIQEAQQGGAEILLDGRSLNWTTHNNKSGYWLGPTIILHKSKNDKALKDEIFGPVLSVYVCKNVEEAIQIENENPYGNAACVYTNDGASAHKLSKELSAGMIGVNIGVPVPREPFSFGGFNDSNIGDGDITGMGGVSFFTKLRKITTKWTPSIEQSWLN